MAANFLDLNPLHPQSPRGSLRSGSASTSPCRSTSGGSWRGPLGLIRQTRSDSEAAKGARQPQSPSALKKLLVCCSQAGLLTSPSLRYTADGHVREKNLLDSGRRSEMPNTGLAARARSRRALVPAQPERFLDHRFAAMAELRTFGRANGDFHQGDARARRRSRLSASRNIPGARSCMLRPNCCCQARYERFSVMTVLPRVTISGTRRPCRPLR